LLSRNDGGYGGDQLLLTVQLGVSQELADLGLPDMPKQPDR
jgi:hypothetical protein